MIHISLEPLSKCDLDALVRDLDLTKQKNELLASRLKEKNLVTQDVRTTNFRTHPETFQETLSFDKNLCYYNDIHGFFFKFTV